MNKTLDATWDIAGDTRCLQKRRDSGDNGRVAGIGSDTPVKRSLKHFTET